MYTSNVIRISPCFRSPRRTESPFYSCDLGVSQYFPNSALRKASSVKNSIVLTKNIHVIGGNLRALANYSEEGPVQDLDSSPVSVELELISSESQFDRVIAEAQQLEESLVVVWMASWCRKCIYLKPKLEKLAADYYPRIRFYCIDVNTVPHRLVVRAGMMIDTLLYLFHVLHQYGRFKICAENADYTVVEGQQKAGRGDRRAQSIFGCE